MLRYRGVMVCEVTDYRLEGLTMYLHVLWRHRGCTDYAYSIPSIASKASRCM